MHVLAFGEILWDIIEGQYHLGGAPFNFAAHCIKCGHQASIVSAVGDDELGKNAIQQAIKLGANVTHLNTLPNKRTGTVDVFLNKGQPDYTIHENVAFDFIPAPKISAQEPIDVFYFGSLAQRNPTSQNTLKGILEARDFKHVFYDINLRKEFYSREIVEYSLMHCTVFKVNDLEADIISKLLYSTVLPLEEFTKKITADFNIPVIIVTAAEKGCYVYHKNILTHVEGSKIEVVDAVGAGDSFSAAFMSVYTSTGNPLKAAVIANKVGAFVATQRGAIPPYSKEVEAIVKH